MKGWTVGVWSGLPNYECTECSFSTLNEDMIEDHVYRVHGIYPADVRKAQEAERLAEESKAAELKALAGKQGLETSGTKAEIAARIVGADPKEMNDGN